MVLYRSIEIKRQSRRADVGESGGDRKLEMVGVEKEVTPPSRKRQPLRRERHTLHVNHFQPQCE